MSKESLVSKEMSRRQVLAAGAALAGSAALVASPFGTAAASAGTAQARSWMGTGMAKTKPTIVLVHGGYADSSCWDEAVQELQGKGYTTICGSNP